MMSAKYLCFDDKRYDLNNGVTILASFHKNLEN